MREGELTGPIPGFTLIFRDCCCVRYAIEVGHSIRIAIIAKVTYLLCLTRKKLAIVMLKKVVRIPFINAVEIVILKRTVMLASQN